MSEALDMLHRALNRGEVVFVAGTGVAAALSDNSTTASWTDLLAEGVVAVAERDTDAGEVLFQQLAIANTPSRMTRVADSIRIDLGDSFGRWLNRTTDSVVDRPELARALAQFSLPILTTNYDTLIEQALDRGSVSWTEPNGMLQVFKGESNSIGHLHGIRTDPMNVIFSHADYSRIRTMSEAQNIQLAAFTFKTFVFIGAGGTLEDDNLGPMAEQFAQTFFTPTARHFRLCRDSEVRAASLDEAVVDVGYGSDHSDLVPFLNELAKQQKMPVQVDYKKRAISEIARGAQEMALISGQESVEVSLEDFSVEPVLLPMTQEEYSNRVIREPANKRPKRLKLGDLLAKGSTILLAGEPGSGVSTALAWIATRACELFDGYPVWIDSPFRKGNRPIFYEIENSRLQRGLPANTSGGELLFVDNLTASSSQRFEKVISNIAHADVDLRAIGVSERDLREVSSALQREGVNDIHIAYVGRFGQDEILALAELRSKDGAEQLANSALNTVLENHLPRTPLTLGIVIELLSRGVSPSDGDSESWLLGKYLDHLLQSEYFSSDRPDNLTVQNKRVFLMAIAEHFVRHLSDEMNNREVEALIESVNDQYAWPYSARNIIDDLVHRHVLIRVPGDRVRFRRSAYLELMAGEFANIDHEFRSHIFSAPIQLRSVICSYVAVNRRDDQALEVAEAQLNRIDGKSISARSLSPVRQLQAPENPIDEIGDQGIELEEDAQLDPDSEVGVLGDESGFELPSDEDPPAFFSAGFEELTPASQAMHIVDLASRVLRDSEQVKNQELKRRVLKRALWAWVQFIDRFERELEDLPDLIVSAGLGEDESRRLRTIVVRLTPLFLAFSGLQACLASPRIERTLIAVEIEVEERSHLSNLVRVLALRAIGGVSWIDELENLSKASIGTFFCSYFLSSLAQQDFIENRSLSEGERSKLLEFIKRCSEARWKFRDGRQRSAHLDALAGDMRAARTRYQMKALSAQQKL